MECAHFDAGRCRSCTLLPLPRPDQVQGKVAEVRGLLDPLGSPEWLAPFTGAESGFRNKAKMVVGGSLEHPTLGLLAPDGAGIDLRDCPLYSPRMHALLPLLADFITLAGLTPYALTTRRGELKHLLVTESAAGEFMVRFVLRSSESLLRIRKHLPTLLSGVAQAGLSTSVISANLQPEHKAVLEGAEEIGLHGDTLTMAVNEVGLHLRPQSFFQTNTEVAAELYRQARDWVAELIPDAGSLDLWDLYCGVGGFALHLATPGRRVTGVEISAEAISSARTTAREAGLDDVDFVAADATAWASAQAYAPDLVVVNPPRRGLGPELADWLEHSGVRHVLYSSCNARTLAQDLARMASLRPVRAQLLDMFPQTGHYEVLLLLSR